MDYATARNIQAQALQMPGGIQALMQGKAEDLLNERAQALAMAQGSADRRMAMLTQAIGMLATQGQRNDDRKFAMEMENNNRQFAKEMAEMQRQHELQMLTLQIAAKRRGGGRGGKKKTPDAANGIAGNEEFVSHVNTAASQYDISNIGTLEADIADARKRGDAYNARVGEEALRQLKNKYTHQGRGQWQSSQPADLPTTPLPGTNMRM